MRLLKLDNDGELQLTRNLFDSEIPQYAILSHTWGEEEDEVLFEDVMQKRVNRNSKGYAKIIFCARQARSDGLDHFWIDTCAIDKSSSAELSEAITSMWRWYREAAKCYVFLSDVSVGGLTWLDTFYRSRWFTRGW
jgi:hypothetical protein